MAQAYYSPIVVQGSQVPSTQSSFPVPYFQTAARFKTIGNGGHVANANGYDIRPYADSALTIPLTYELVPGTYNASTGFFEMWVLIPSLSNGITIYFGYGDASLTTDGSSSSTWPSQYKGVWHFPNGSSLTVLDSTSNANNGTNSGATATTGVIDGGANLNGSTDFINLGTSSSLNPANDLTIQAWAVCDTPSPTNVPIMVGRDSSGAAERAYNIYQGFNTPTGNFGVFKSNAGQSDVNGSTTLTPGQNYLYTGTYHYVSDGSSVLKIYVNDTLDGTESSAVGPIQSTSNRTVVGRRDYPGFEFPFGGMIDEIRILEVALSLDWVKTDFNSQSNNPAFWALGTEVPVGGSSGNPWNYYAQMRAA